MNREKERIEQCTLANCQYYQRCMIKWGKDCIRQGGKKIPRFRQVNWGAGKLVVTGGPGEEVRIWRAGGDPY